MKNGIDKVEFELSGGQKDKKRIIWLAGMAIPVLTREEESTLLKGKKPGQRPSNRVMEKLILSNIPILIYICAKEFNLVKTHMMQDAISISIESMIDSAKYFDPKKGTKFISYAMVSIRQKIIHFIVKNKTAESRGGTFRKNAMAVVKFLSQNNDIYLKESTVTLISKAIGLSERSVRDVIPYLSGNEDINMYDDVDSGDSIRPGQVLSNILCVRSKENEIEKKEEKNRLKKSMKDSLSQEEYFILSRSFGLEGHNNMTLEEIGNMFLPTITKQAVSLRYRKAMKKLTNNKTIQSIDRKVVYDC